MGLSWLCEFKFCNTDLPGVYEYSWRLRDRYTEGCTLGSKGVKYEPLCWVERSADKKGWVASAIQTLSIDPPKSHKNRELAAQDFLENKFRKEAFFTKPNYWTWPHRSPVGMLISTQEADEIMEILKKECGFSEREDYFKDSITEDQENSGREFRFCGYLGFGGKFHYSSSGYFVNTYSEESDGATDLMVAKANKQLGHLWRKYTPAHV